MTAATPWKLTGPKYSHNMRLWLNKHVKSRTKTLPTALVEKSTGRVFLHITSYEGTNEWYGAWVGRIITQGSRAMTAYHPGMRVENFRKDSTFWDRYADTGICTLDPAHHYYSERWECEGDPETQLPGQPAVTRTCQYCGLTQRQYTWDEQVIERKRRWF